MTDQEIAIEAAWRIMRRRLELYPNWNSPVSGFAANGREFRGPYCGGDGNGDTSAWEPPPGAEYVQAGVEMDGSCRTYVLRQKTIEM